jgi:hypothetical protein
MNSSYSHATLERLNRLRFPALDLELVCTAEAGGLILGPFRLAVQARAESRNPIFACEPSQNGLFSAAPQRQSA